MENNKYYLQKIPVIALLVALSALVYVFVPDMLPKSWGGEGRINFVYGFFFLYDIILYVSFGLITRKWAAALVSMVVSMGIYAAGLKWVYGGGYTIWIYLFSLFNSIAPLLLFLLISNFQPKKIVLNFLLLLICLKTVYPIFWSSGNEMEFFIFDIKSGTFWYQVITFSFFVFPLLMQILFISEIINYNNGKANWFRPRLINLGNLYPLGAAIIVQVVLNLGLVLLLANCYNLLKQNISFIAFGVSMPSDIHFAVLVQHISQSVCYLFFIALYGWYYRKFMLEFFVSRNLTSKLLYWFCCSPVIGLIVFLVAVLLNQEKEQKDHQSRSRSLSAFAGSSSSPVSALMISGLLLQLLYLSDKNSPVLIISTVVSLLILFWMISRPAGYYVNLVLNILAFAGLQIASFTASIKPYQEVYPSAILFSILAVSIIPLIMVLPVFHISQFEYVPDMPQDEPEEGGDLFPEYNPYPS